jgi:hypothetical protein
MQNIEIGSRKPLRHPPPLEAHLHGVHLHPKHHVKKKRRMTQSQRGPLNFNVVEKATKTMRRGKTSKQTLFQNMENMNT